jgi:hypothetical protein
VSASAAGLTSAERHLLEIGREEVARLLLIEFRERLEREQDGSFIYLGRRMTLAEWSARAGVASSRLDAASRGERLSRRAASGVEMSAVELLEACMDSTRPRRVDRTDLLVMSQRLVDRPTTRIYVAIDLVVRGRLKAAHHALLNLVSNNASPDVQYYARVWHAMILGASADPMAAAQAFVRAESGARSVGGLDGSRRLSLLSALWFAARAGDTTYLEAIDRLLRSTTPHADLDARFIDHHRATPARKASQGPSHSEQTLNRIRSLADSIGGTSREIVYAAL